MVAFLDRLRRARDRMAQAGPPEPPDLATREVHLRYVAGVLAVAALPVAHVLGFAERSEARRRVVGNDVEIEARFPTQLRFKQTAHLRADVTNRAARAQDLEVTIDRAWIEAFDGVTVTPAPAEAWTVRFPDVPPGEARHVVVAAEGEHRGRLDGALLVRAGDEAHEIAFRTFVFP
jgi:hypothetical protein